MKIEYKGIMAPCVYDPKWLVGLCEMYRPEDNGLIEAAKKCKWLLGFCDCGCGGLYFVDPNSEEWRWSANRVVNFDTNNGATVVFDILADGRIGGVEVLG